MSVVIEAVIKCQACQGTGKGNHQTDCPVCDASGAVDTSVALDDAALQTLAIALGLNPHVQPVVLPTAPQFQGLEPLPEATEPVQAFYSTQS